MSTETNFTKEDIKELEKAIAKGVRKVKYTDKEIEYRSIAEMRETLDLMRREVNCVKKTRRCVMSTSKGLC